MTVEDGGATFSLIIRGQLLTIEELELLKGLDGVDKVLVDNNVFTVVFKTDSFSDITAATVISAQQAIKETLRNITHSHTSSPACKKGAFTGL